MNALEEVAKGRQKLVLDADDARFDEILREVITVAKKVEPDCELYL